MTLRRWIGRLRAALRALRPRPYRGARGLGQRWERAAERRLAAEGYAIRERNFRARAGEIDLIAREKGVLCFIEVKGRRALGFGAPGEAVTEEKQRRIARAAQEYLRRERLPPATPCRFDVVTILESGGRTEVRVLRGAFDEPGPRRGREPAC